MKQLNLYSEISPFPSLAKLQETEANLNRDNQLPSDSLQLFTFSLSTSITGCDCLCTPLSYWRECWHNSSFCIDDCLIVLVSFSNLHDLLTPNMTPADNNNHDDGSPPTTPLASQTPTATTSTINTHLAVPPLGSSSQSSTDPSTTGFFLPIPTPSTNKSQSSFTYSDRSWPDSDSAIGPFNLDALSSEILNADLSLAGPCSFHPMVFIYWSNTLWVGS